MKQLLCILVSFSFLLAVPVAAEVEPFTIKHYFRHDYGTVSSALGDVDGDGTHDVVLSTDTGEITAYTLDGITIWSKDFDSPGRSLSVIRKGTERYVLFYNDKGFVYLLDSNGNSKWNLYFPLTKPINSLVASDLDGDRVPEIVVGFKDATFSVYTISGTQWRKENDFYQFYVMKLYTADFATTEYETWDEYPLGVKVDLSWIFPDVIASGERDPNIYLYDPTGKKVWEIENVYPIEQVYSGDINNDQQMEVITASYKYLQVFGLEGKLWRNILESYIYSFGVGDINKDGKKEVAVGTVDGWLYLFDSKGYEVWNDPQLIGKDVRYVTIDDFTGDGLPEILVAAGKWSSSKQEIDQGTFYVFSSDGEKLSETNVNGPIKTVSIVDIDSDGYKDVIVCSNYVFVYKNNFLTIFAGRHYAEGERLLLRAQFDDSIKEFAKSKELYTKLGDADAVKRCEKNIMTAVEYKALNAQAMELFNNANTELNNGNYDKALEKFNEARRIFEKVGNKAMVATTDAMISETSSKIQPITQQTLPLSPTLILIPILLIVAVLGGALGFLFIRRRKRI
jgi:tetratricopeptide (TPR) repeat protein